MTPIAGYQLTSLLIALGANVAIFGVLLYLNRCVIFRPRERAARLGNGAEC